MPVGLRLAKLAMAKTAKQSPSNDNAGPSARGESDNEYEELIQRCDDRSSQAKQHLAASQHGGLIRASPSPPPTEEPADEPADKPADETGDAGGSVDEDEIPLARLVKQIP